MERKSAGKRRTYARCLGLVLLAAVFTVSPTPTLAGSGSPDPNPMVHVVKQGESLSVIAKRYGVSVKGIAQFNGIKDPNRLKVGQKIVIPGAAKGTPGSSGKESNPPPPRPTVHKVRQGESLWTIAKLYSVTVTDLVNQNNLKSPDRLRVGLVLKLPDKARLGRLSPSRGGGLVFIRPVEGRLTSEFGPRWGRMHEGVDFGAPVGTPIRASADGTVGFVGSRGGYGRLVIVAHGGGVETYYAHASKVYVGRGQRVKQGEVIATVGMSGEVTGPNLHFEIRLNGKPVDPSGFMVLR